MNVNETKVMTLLNQLSTLNMDEMRVVSKGLVQMINQQHQIKQVAVSAKFRPGQIVRFTKSGRGRNAGTHYIRIEGFNRAGTAVQGYPCTPNGDKTSDSHIRWTVSCTSLTLVA